MLEPFAVAASGFECDAWSDAAEDGCCCCIEEENRKPVDGCCLIYAAATAWLCPWGAAPTTCCALCCCGNVPYGKPVRGWDIEYCCWYDARYMAGFKVAPGR